MIVFFENGRLGNQLFQYAALKELYPNQCLVMFGCGELKQAVESIDAIVIEKEKLSRWVVFGLRQLLLVLAKFRVIGTIQESRENAKFFVNKVEGVVGIYMLKCSFFQHQSMLGKLNPHLRLNHIHSCIASDWLSHKIFRSRDQSLIFIHIRRGDYLTWPNREYPAVLDKYWYCKAIDHMREKIKHPVFLLVTDDPYYAKDCFGDQPDILISENDQLVDLVLMSLCQHGILSASSFAWWGAFYARSNQKEGAIFLAPKYWAGHRAKQWVPADFRTEWITYLE